MRDRMACFLCLLVCLSVAALGSGGCGDDGSPKPSPTATGRFLDSPVEGLAFESDGQTGTTDSLGVFIYEVGRTVSFRIGGIGLGEGVARSVMTPVDLVQGAVDESTAAVTNITRVLLTLDDDGDASNGIVLTDAVRTAAAGRSIDFDQSPTSFEDDSDVLTTVAELTALTSAGSRPLVSTETARDHLRSTLLGILAGTYDGTYKGDDTGTWTITVYEGGAITGEGNGVHAGDFDIWGTVTGGGSMDFVAGGVSVDASFSGAIHRDGTVSGSWWGNNDPTSGTFLGKRVE